MTKRKGETRDEYLARRKVYRTEHHEEIAEYNQAYRVANQDVIRARRLANREETLAKHRAYNAAHYHELYAYRMRPDVRVRETAHTAVSHAIRAGWLVPPKRCDWCGNTPAPTYNGSRSIEAHHYKGYEQKYWFDVIWLCPNCHVVAHSSDKECCA